METWDNDVKPIQKQWFKSYYVVWKLFPICCAVAFRTAFKSYYVVWKLVYASRIIPIVVRFKSYYVVWKLFQGSECLQCAWV